MTKKLNPVDIEIIKMKAKCFKQREISTKLNVSMSTISRRITKIRHMSNTFQVQVISDTY